MKRPIALFAVSLLCVGMSMAEDGIVATEVQGGPPQIGKDGKHIPPRTNIVAEITGVEFDKVRSEAKAIITLMENEETWWDVGPDGEFVSVVIELDGNKYTINTWYPLFKDKETIAVTENGLVAVASRREKEARESQNEEKYKTLTRFLDKVLKMGTPTKPTVP